MKMTRLALATLLALAAAVPASAQNQAAAAALASRSAVGTSAAGAVTVSPVRIPTGFVRSISASAGFVPPTAEATFSGAHIRTLPVTTASFPFLPPVAIQAPALRVQAAGADSVVPPADGSAPDTGKLAAPEIPGDRAARSGRAPVLSSLKELARLRGDSGAKTFDGAALHDGEPQIDPDGVRPSIPAGVQRLDVEPVTSVRDVDRLIPQFGNSQDLHDQLRVKLAEMVPFDIFVYHDAKGGKFTGVDVGHRPENIERMPELQRHEIDTIKKIHAYTSDLQILVREEGATPDLVVGGVVSEMKSAHGLDSVSVQLAHANDQLVKHAKRHGLAKGAAILDLVGAKDPADARLESEIAKVADTREIGFDRVYVFVGPDARVFARDDAGRFQRVDEVPFRRSANPALAPKAGGAVEAAAKALGPETRDFVIPSALQKATLPDAGRVMAEIHEPSQLLRRAGIEATVTLYGSARIKPPEVARANFDEAVKKWGRRPKTPEGRRELDEAREALRQSKYYPIAVELGRLIAKAGGGKIAVVTGGGGGIMEAGNRGAKEAGGPSVGYNITLPHEQKPNAFQDPALSYTFEHFALRKMALRYGSMGLVYFPGGWGTMDELFEVLTLMQTGKMARVLIVLVGERSYWDEVVDFKAFERKGLISHGDRSMFVFADTAEQAWDAIRAHHSVEAKK